MSMLYTDDEIDTAVAEALGWKLDPRTRIWNDPAHSLTFDHLYMSFPPAPAYAGCSNDYWRPTRDARQVIRVLATLPKTPWRMSFKVADMDERFCEGFTFSALDFVVEDTSLPRCLCRGFLEIRRSS